MTTNGTELLLICLIVSRRMQASQPAILASTGATEARFTDYTSPFSRAAESSPRTRADSTKDVTGEGVAKRVSGDAFSNGQFSPRSAPNSSVMFARKTTSARDEFSASRLNGQLTSVTPAGPLSFLSVRTQFSNQIPFDRLVLDVGRARIHQLAWHACLSQVFLQLDAKI